MFSFQTAGNHFKHRLFFNLSNFNKSSIAMICSNKCSFPFIQFKKVAPLQEQQQLRMFRHSCLLQNSPNAASSIPVNLDVEEATTTNEEFSTAAYELEAQRQQFEDNEMQADPTKPIQTESALGSKLFAEKFYPRQTTREKLFASYRMGESGHKCIQIFKKNGATFLSNFPNIHVPEDVFGFVRAMDEVLEAVHAKRSIIEASSKPHQIIYIAKAKGKNYDYWMKLSIFDYFVQVRMRTMPNECRPEHISKYKVLSLHQFHWLRHAIGELFAENGEKDVQQQFGKPPGYPNWLNIDGIPFVLLERNQQHQTISNTSIGYNNQYNSIRNLLPDNRRNLQSQLQQNMQFDQRKLLQRIAPVQQQPAQPQMPSSWAAMSQQLLQLVFLQQQQLQQVQRAILSKMEEGRTTQEAIASPQYQEERTFNNKNSMVRPGMQYKGEWQRNAGRKMAGIDQAASNNQSSKEARKARSEPYFSQLLDDYE